MSYSTFVTNWKLSVTEPSELRDMLEVFNSRQYTIEKLSFVNFNNATVLVFQQQAITGVPVFAWLWCFVVDVACGDEHGVLGVVTATLRVFLGNIRSVPSGAMFNVEWRSSALQCRVWSNKVTHNVPSSSRSLYCSWREVHTTHTSQRTRGWTHSLKRSEKRKYYQWSVMSNWP